MGRPGGNVRVTGPKGGTISKRTPLSGLAKVLPGWLHRYGRVTVRSASTSPAPKQKLTQRQLIVQWWHWSIANTKAIHYAEIRPIPRLKTRALPRLPFTTDCSGAATMSYDYAGAKDPNGLSFDGRGYTGTLLKGLRRTTLAKLKLGDVVIFGCRSYPNGHHAAVVIAIHARTYAGVILGSHGSENGPLQISLAEECRYQPDGRAGVVFRTDPSLH